MRTRGRVGISLVREWEAAKARRRRRSINASERHSKKPLPCKRAFGVHTRDRDTSSRASDVNRNKKNNYLRRPMKKT